MHAKLTDLGLDATSIGLAGSAESRSARPRELSGAHYWKGSDREQRVAIMWEAKAKSINGA